MNKCSEERLGRCRRFQIDASAKAAKAVLIVIIISVLVVILLFARDHIKRLLRRSLGAGKVLQQVYVRAAH